MLNAETLAALPGHAWVINVGRGDAVDEDALLSSPARPAVSAGPRWT